MRKLVAAVALFALCGCEGAIKQWTGTRPAVRQVRNVAAVDAQCGSLTFTFTGWPEDAYAIVGIADSPPIGVFAQGTTERPAPSASYGWSVSVFEGGVLAEPPYRTGGTEVKLLRGASDC